MLRLLRTTNYDEDIYKLKVTCLDINEFADEVLEFFHFLPRTFQ